MSLNGAMNSAVSALQAQSQALALISDNLANSGTTGYKASTTSFSELVTQQATGNSYSSGGVIASTRQNVDYQGLIQATSTATDMAIDGNGMFAVSEGVDGQETYFTRNGEFDINSDGYLCNGNYYLQGWTTDSSGKVTTANQNSLSALEPINVNRFSSTAAATTTASINANLPSDAAVGASFNTTLDVYDSLGDTHNVKVTWTKTGTNAWTVAFANPTLSGGTTSSGTISPSTAVPVTFNSDGSLASPASVSLAISGWSTGAAASAITFTLGTVGKTDGLSQYASNLSTPTVTVKSIDQDGVKYGQLSGIEIGDDGKITASYDNGMKLVIYQVPLVTFPNMNGLSAMSDGIYTATMQAGNYTLHAAGEGGAGTIAGSSLESSTTDTSEQFSRMIVAQQAYSAASQIITTTKDMFDSLLSAVR